jgi:phosphate transport system substrate-binding protein
MKMFKNLKSLVVGLALVAFINPFANAQIVVKGSDTCLPISQQEAEAYGKKGGNVTVTGGGSGVGIAALISGTCDIAQASRPMKFDEKQKMSDAGKTPKEVIIGYDALAVIVNPENPVSQLTRKQLEQIYTGKVTNWKEVGGPDLKIVVYSRETSSGTYEFFKEHVMKNKNYLAAALSMPATGAIIQSVKQTKGAIGYVGLAYLNKEVKAIQVSYDEKTFVAPTVTNAKNKSYPIVRELYYYYNTNNEKKVKPFVDFILSNEGQKIVDKVGYISHL